MKKTTTNTNFIQDLNTPWAKGPANIQYVGFILGRILGSFLKSFGAHGMTVRRKAQHAAIESHMRYFILSEG